MPVPNVDVSIGQQVAQRLECGVDQLRAAAVCADRQPQFGFTVAQVQRLQYAVVLALQRQLKRLRQGIQYTLNVSVRPGQLNRPLQRANRALADRSAGALQAA